MFPFLSTRRTCSVFFIFLAMLSYGCTHLHNDVNAKIAKDTLDEFNNFKKISSNPYRLMIQNISLVEGGYSQLQIEAAKTTTSAFARQIHSTKWKDIRSYLEDEKKSREASNKENLDNIKDLLTSIGIKESELTTLEKIKKNLDTNLNDAVQNQKEWKAKHLLFRGAAKLLIDSEGSDDKINEQKINQGIKKILEQKVPYEDKDLTTLEDVTVKTVLNLNNVNSLKDLKSIIQNNTNNIYNPNSAPGISLIILGLGEDLAEAEINKTKLSINYLKTVKDLCSQGVRDIGYINQAISILKKNRSFDNRDDVLKTFKDLHLQIVKAESQNKDSSILSSDVKALYRVLAWYSISSTIDENKQMEWNEIKEVIKHEYSIQVSEINGAEQEALITRGLQGLAIYHDGGLTSEQIANLISAAQAVALGVIGAGVI